MARHRRWMLIAVGLPLYTASLMLIVTAVAATLLDPGNRKEWGPNAGSSCYPPPKNLVKIQAGTSMN